MEDVNSKEISGRVSPQHREKLDPNNYSKHHLSVSSSKILRSLSTPEMRDKNNFKAASAVTSAEMVKPTASRQMNFSEMPQSKHANKENTNPILSYQTLEGSCNTLESVFQNYQTKPLEKGMIGQSTPFQSLFTEDLNLGGAKATKSINYEISNTGDTLKKLLDSNILSESKPVVSQKEQMKSDHFIKSMDAKLGHNIDQVNLSQKSSFSKCNQTPNQKTSVPQTILPQCSSHSKLSPDSTIGHLANQSSAPSQKKCLMSSVSSSRALPTTGYSESCQKSEAQTVKEVPVGIHRNVTSEKINTRTGLAKDNTDLDHPKHSSVAAVPQQRGVSQLHHNGAQSVLASHTSISDEYKQSKISKVAQNNHPTPQATTTKSNSPATVELKSKETPVINRTQPRQFQTPSGQILRVMPPTPPTKQKLQQMDHIVVNNQEYLKLGLVGRGGSSKVYEVRS